MPKPATTWKFFAATERTPQLQPRLGLELLSPAQAWPRPDQQVRVVSIAVSHIFAD